MNQRAVIILIIVLLLLFGVGGFAPDFGTHHGYIHHDYAWGPSGGFGLLVVVLIILLVLGGI